MAYSTADDAACGQALRWGLTDEQLKRLNQAGMPIPTIAAGVLTWNAGGLGVLESCTDAAVGILDAGGEPDAIAVLERVQLLAAHAAILAAGQRDGWVPGDIAGRLPELTARGVNYDDLEGAVAHLSGPDELTRVLDTEAGSWPTHASLMLAAAGIPGADIVWLARHDAGFIDVLTGKLIAVAALEDQDVRRVVLLLATTRPGLDIDLAAGLAVAVTAAVGGSPDTFARFVADGWKIPAAVTAAVAIDTDQAAPSRTVSRPAITPTGRDRDL
jgi:hypothetical protein